MVAELAMYALFIVPAVVFIAGAVLWAGWGLRKLGVSLMGAGLVLGVLLPVVMMQPASSTAPVYESSSPSDP